MEESWEAPNLVLSYEPPAAQPRLRRWFCSGAVAAAVMTLGVSFWMNFRRRPMVCLQATSFQRRIVTVGQGTIQVETNGTYAVSDEIFVPCGRFFLIRDGGDVVAIRVHSDEGEAIHYDWVYRHDGGVTFDAPGSSYGFGTAGEVGRSKRIHAGPMELEWSPGDRTVVQVYWPADRPGLQISSEVIDDLASAGRDPAAKWYSRQGPFP